MEVPPKTAPRLFLIDAYALIYRAFFAFIQRPLINSKGENTSAPFGFTRFLLEVLDDYEPDYIAVVFDAGSSQREEIYAEYKATRNKMPDELQWSLWRLSPPNKDEYPRQQDLIMGSSALDKMSACAQLVDQEVKRTLDEAYERARSVLERERALLEAIATALLEIKKGVPTQISELAQHVQGRMALTASN